MKKAASQRKKDYSYRNNFRQRENLLFFCFPFLNKVKQRHSGIKIYLFSTGGLKNENGININAKSEISVMHKK